VALKMVKTIKINLENFEKLEKMPGKTNNEKIEILLDRYFKGQSIRHRTD
jgi:hypothetical protein